MVLVFMFYLVGEAAFRTILLIISFVFCVTLLLACFLCQTTIIFGQPGTSSSSPTTRANPQPPEHQPTKLQAVLLHSSQLNKSPSVDTTTNCTRMVPANAPGSQPIWVILPSNVTTIKQSLPVQGNLESHSSCSPIPSPTSSISLSPNLTSQDSSRNADAFSSANGSKSDYADVHI